MVVINGIDFWEMVREVKVQLSAVSEKTLNTIYSRLYNIASVIEVRIDKE